MALAISSLPVPDSPWINTGASVAALTVYDMCKAMSHDIVIGDTRLIEKTGGKSDYRAKESAA